MKNTIMVNGKRKTCRIYDAGHATLDRYTIAFRGRMVTGYGMIYPYIASSDSPFHPQGFGQHGESREFITGSRIGKRVSFDELPADVQKFILQSI